MVILYYTLAVLALTIGLVVASYLDRVYRELGHSSGGRTHEHLEVFEAEIEPRFKIERARAALAFSLLARFWIVLVAAGTVLGGGQVETGRWQAALEIVLLLGAEVVIAMQLLPLLLIV